MGLKRILLGFGRRAGRGALEEVGVLPDDDTLSSKAAHQLRNLIEQSMYRGVLRALEDFERNTSAVQIGPTTTTSVNPERVSPDKARLERMTKEEIAEFKRRLEEKAKGGI